MKAWKHIPVFWTDNVLSFLPIGADTIGVEFIANAKSLPNFRHPERGFYIFGPEDGDIPEETQVKCKRIVTIPTLR
jgi:tRNA(Leu) C34 or U34 (ribose-2'-O)-methylase TrmL